MPSVKPGDIGTIAYATSDVTWDFDTCTGSDTEECYKTTENSQACGAHVLMWMDNPDDRLEIKAMNKMFEKLREMEFTVTTGFRYWPDPDSATFIGANAAPLTYRLADWSDSSAKTVGVAFALIASTALLQ